MNVNKLALATGSASKPGFRCFNKERSSPREGSKGTDILQEFSDAPG